MVEQALTILAGAAGAVAPVAVACWLNERSKQHEAARLRSEERYLKLLNELAAFYDSPCNGWRLPVPLLNGRYILLLR